MDQFQSYTRKNLSSCRMELNRERMVRQPIVMCCFLVATTGGRRGDLRVRTVEREGRFGSDFIPTIKERKIETTLGKM